MKRTLIIAVIILFMLMIFTCTTILAKTWIKVMQPRVKDPTGKVGETFVLQLRSDQYARVKNLLIMGGIENEGAPLYNKTVPVWPKSPDQFPRFSWTPKFGGSYVAYFEIDPNNQQGLKKKVTLQLQISGSAKPGDKNPPKDPPPEEKKYFGALAAEYNLEIVAAKLVKYQVTEGDPLVFEITFKNAGATTIFSRVDVAMMKQLDKKCQASSSGSFAVGASRTVKCTIPSYPAGTHSLRAVVNPDNTITEPHYMDNELPVKFTVHPKGTMFIKKGGNAGLPSLGTRMVDTPLVMQPTRSAKLSLYDWYIEKGGKQVSKFSSPNEKVDLVIVFHISGSGKFQGTLVDVGFDNTSPTAQRIKYWITLNRNVALTLPSVYTAKVEGIKVSDFLATDVNAPLGQDVKLRYKFTPFVEGERKSRNFNWVLPDLQIFPASYEVKCQPERSIKMTFRIVSKYIQIPSKQTLHVGYSYTYQGRVMGKLIKSLGQLEGWEIHGGFSERTFETPWISKYIENDDKTSFIKFCCAIDTKQVIKEFNERNNHYCVDIWYSEYKGTKCIPRKNTISPADLYNKGEYSWLDR